MSKSGSRPERLDAVFEWLDRGHFARSERPLDWRVARWLDVIGVAFIFYFFVSTKLLSSLILDSVWEVFQVVDRRYGLQSKLLIPSRDWKVANLKASCSEFFEFILVHHGYDKSRSTPFIGF